MQINLIVYRSKKGQAFQIGSFHSKYNLILGGLALKIKIYPELLVASGEKARRTHKMSRQARLPRHFMRPSCFFYFSHL
jgi:hypothetical protein